MKWRKRNKQLLGYIPSVYSPSTSLIHLFGVYEVNWRMEEQGWLHCSQLGKVLFGLLGACWSLWEVSQCSLSSFSSFLLLVINAEDCKHLEFHIAQFLDLEMGI